MGQFITPTNPLTTLQALPDETLYSIATNDSAAHRTLALQLLVERCSVLAGRPEVAAEAHQMILDNPSILKKVNPSAGLAALKMPGVLDVLVDSQSKRIALERTISEHHTTHTDNHTALSSTVNANKAASEDQLRAAYAALWADATRKAFQLTEDMSAQEVELDGRIAELRDQHTKDIDATTERLRLLERSPWRKLVDWGKKNVQVMRGWLQIGKLKKIT